MATGNIFLGQGRRSIGDVTLYRSRGQQRARVRVRKIANPRSYGQMLQRAVISNCSRLYSLGREIFDHSFQGYKQGADNQLRFMRVNSARLRALLETDRVEDRDWDVCQGRIGARGLNVAAPFVGLQVSEGSLSQDLFLYSSDSHVYFLPVYVEGETVAQYAARIGLVAGDIYTFGFFVIDNSPSKAIAYYGRHPGDPVRDLLQYVFPVQFSYVQLMVKSGLADVTTVVTVNTPLTTFFDLAGPLAGRVSSFIQDTTFGSSTPVPGTNVGPMFLVRSNYGSGERSTAFTVPTVDVVGYGTAPFGLTWNEMQEAWGDAASSQEVSEILDGENFDS